MNEMADYLNQRWFCVYWIWNLIIWENLSKKTGYDYTFFYKVMAELLVFYYMAIARTYSVIILEESNMVSWRNG